MNTFDELRAEFDLPSVDLKEAGPSQVFEFAATACDFFKMVGWHCGPLSSGEINWWPCDPQCPSQIHPECQWYLQRNTPYGPSAKLRIEEAGFIEIKIGREVDKYSNLMDFFERIIVLVGGGYGKIEPHDVVHRLALRVAARQAGQPTDSMHINIFEKLLKCRIFLDDLMVIR